MTAHLPSDRLAEILRRGLRTEGTAYVLTDRHGHPLACVAGSARALEAVAGRDGVQVSRFSPQAAAQAPRDLLHLVLRAGRVVVVTAALPGRAPAALLPLHAQAWLRPTRTGAETVNHPIQEGR